MEKNQNIVIGVGDKYYGDGSCQYGGERSVSEYLEKLSSYYDFSKVSRLNWENTNLESLEGLGEILPNLEVAYLPDNKIQNLDGVGHLPKLEELNLNRNGVDNLEGLISVPKLEELYLRENEVEDVTPLEYVPKLERLFLSGNKIKELGVGSLEDLRVLNASDNDIEDLREFRDLYNLVFLDLSNNKIKTMAGIEGLPKLRNLYLSGNEVKEVRGLQNLKYLNILHLGDSLEEIDKGSYKMLKESECIMDQDFDVGDLRRRRRRVFGWLLDRLSF